MSIEDLINGLDFDSEPYRIRATLICQDCMAEVKANPEAIPKDYVSVEVGFTDTGVQIWCRRHQRSIAHFETPGEGELPY